MLLKNCEPSKNEKETMNKICEIRSAFSVTNIQI